jgi:hypothetical protein
MGLPSMRYGARMVGATWEVQQRGRGGMRIVYTLAPMS